MKTALYVATVARTYRKAIDDYLEDPELYQQEYAMVSGSDSVIVRTDSSRPDSTLAEPDDEAQIYDSNTYVREYTYLGIIGGERDGMYRIEQRNKFSVGETIELMKPNGDNIEVTVKKIVDEDGNEQESAPHPKQVLYIDLGGHADQYDILRRKED